MSDSTAQLIEQARAAEKERTDLRNRLRTHGGAMIQVGKLLQDHPVTLSVGQAVSIGEFGTLINAPIESVLDAQRVRSMVLELIEKERAFKRLESQLQQLGVKLT